MLTQLQVSELTADLAQALALVDKVSKAVHAAGSSDHYRMTKKALRRTTKHLAESVSWLLDDAAAVERWRALK